MAIIAILIVIPLASFSVWASDTGQKFLEKNDSSKLQVVSSFYPLYDFSQKIGKDKVNVILLVPVGVEPHDWEPTIQDVQSMQNSDLIVINGVGFESWVDNLTEIGYQGEIVDTSIGIDVIKTDFIDEHEEEEHHESGDPHIWLNPVMAKIQVQNIADAFSRLDSKNEEFYQRNAKEYLHKLDELDFKIRHELSQCNDEFIAFHDAFSYFAREYGLHQNTVIASNDPHIEPTAKILEDVINTARNKEIKVIFTEETADPRTSEVIANEIGAKTLVLSPIEIATNGDYISRMNENLENLKEALC